MCILQAFLNFKLRLDFRSFGSNSRILQLKPELVESNPENQDISKSNKNSDILNLNLYILTKLRINKT